MGQNLFQYYGEQQQQHCTSKQIWTILCDVITLFCQAHADFSPGAPPWRRDLCCWAWTVRARAQLNKQILSGNCERGCAFLYGGVVLVTVSLSSLSLSLSLLTFVLIFVDELRIVTFNYVCYHTIPNFQLEEYYSIKLKFIVAFLLCIVFF